MGCDLGATTAAIKVARRPACIAYPRAQTSRVTSQEIDWLRRAIVNRDQVATGGPVDSLKVAINDQQ